MYKQTPSRKQFECPVCHDSTKDGHVEHWVRRNGSAVCPTLLGIRCGECGDTNHTTKKCLEKKREERDRRRTLFKLNMHSYSTGDMVKSTAATESVPPAEHLRKVEELKRISADKAIGGKGGDDDDESKTNKKDAQFIRVFYS